MTPIKHLLNNVLDIKSDKHNLNQGNEFVKNKMKYLFKPKLIEGMGCTINDRNDPKYARFLIPSNDSHVLDGASCTLDENKPAGVTCDSSTGLFAFSGCEPVTIGELDRIRVNSIHTGQITGVTGQSRFQLYHELSARHLAQIIFQIDCHHSLSPGDSFNPPLPFQYQSTLL